MRYYTPDITDLRIGFELETRDPDFQSQSDGGEWKKEICDSQTIVEIIDAWRHFRDYRVPYLTREDIEKEGWEMVANDEIVIADRVDDGIVWSLLYYEEDKRLCISSRAVDVDRVFDCNKFRGTCHCINDFRLICKMLGI